MSIRTAAAGLACGALVIFAARGPVGVLMTLLYATAILVGAILGLGMLGAQAYRRHFSFRLPGPTPGLSPVVLQRLTAGPVAVDRLDRRVTGAGVVDEAFQELLALMFRDYCHSWFSGISGDPEFPTELQRSTQAVLVRLSQAAKAMDWVAFATTTAVDEFTMHLRYFQRAQVRVDEESAARGTLTSVQSRRKLDVAEADVSAVEQKFLQIERRWSTICTSPEHEAAYLRDLADVLLYLLLPPGDFETKGFRLLCREILAFSVLQPTVKMLCDPDYTNQSLAVLLPAMTLTYDALIDTIRCDSVPRASLAHKTLTHALGSTCESPKELAIIMENIEADTSDALGSAGAAPGAARNKARLDALIFAKRECQTKLRQLTGSKAAAVHYAELPLLFVLHHRVAEEYFHEYMVEQKWACVLEFWKAANAYQANALAYSDDGGADLMDDLYAEAMSIVDRFFTVGGAEDIKMKPQVFDDIKRTLAQTPEALPATLFETAQTLVLRSLEKQFFPGFLKNERYHKCVLAVGASDDDVKQFLADLQPGDADADTSDTLSVRSMEGATLRSFGGSHESLNSVAPSSLEAILSGQESLPTGAHWDVEIASCQHIQEDAGGKNFHVYVVCVNFTAPSGEASTWEVHRRYSEFDDFHNLLKKKYPALIASSGLTLPGKKLLGRETKDFLDRRMEGLSRWVRLLFSSAILKHNADVETMLGKFFGPSSYKKGTGKKILTDERLERRAAEAASAAGTSASPVLGAFSFPPAATRVAKDVIDPIEREAKDNIPFRILLSVLDEIFQLSNNQWLRKRVVPVLSQVITTMLGKGINRRIVDSIQRATSLDHVAGYIAQLQEAMWPGGVPAPPACDRSQDCKMRTRLEARIKLFGLLPDQIKRIIGESTTKKGVNCLFDLFQCRALNKRFCYVILEAVLIKMFPENKFNEILSKLHDASLK